MFSTTALLLLNFLVPSWIGECLGLTPCVGVFYKTSVDYYYGRYYVNTDYSHRYYYSYGYNNDGPKYCVDQCCTANDNYHKFCCSKYGHAPSYTSSSRTSSTTGIIIGCTFGGTLFAVVVLFSLLVARCMWKDRKRIDPVSIETGSNKTEEVIPVDTLMIGPSSIITAPSVKAAPATDHTSTC